MQNPRKPSPRQQRRERELAFRRADVAATASAVFAEKGFDGAQMSEIAARAEVSTASLYTMFEGKDELYQEVIINAASAVADRVRQDVEALDDPREQVLSVIDSLFACWEEDQDLFRVYARATHGLPWRIREALGESFLRLFQEFTAWVAGLAERAQRAGCLPGLDLETFSLALVGTAMTTATHWIETNPDLPLSAAAPAVRAIFERLVVHPEKR